MKHKIYATFRNWKHKLTTFSRETSQDKFVTSIHEWSKRILVLCRRTPKYMLYALICSPIIILCFLSTCSDGEKTAYRSDSPNIVEGESGTREKKSSADPEKEKRAERAKSLLLTHGISEEKYNEALVSAAILNRSDIMELLIDAGVNVNYRQPGEWAPLHYAAAKGNTECLKILLKSGADVDATTPLPHRMTALDIAMMNNHSICANFIRLAGGSTIFFSDYRKSR